MINIFLGFLFDEDKEESLISNSSIGVQNAANQYQKGFLMGLTNKAIIYSALCVGSYPKNNKQLYYAAQVCNSKYGEIHYLPFLNLHFLKDICFVNALKKEFKSILKKQDEVMIYVYSLYVPFLRIIKKIKKKYSNRVRICLIVPDLPGRYGIVRKWYTIGGFRDRIESNLKMKLATIVDNYVFLTKHMADLFSKKPNIVIEGFLPDIQYDYNQKRVAKSILYTGSLNPNYGILDLLDAFSLIDDPEYQLWICGAGGVEEIIRDRSHKDSRIHFYGFLNKKVIVKMQSSCDVLVNPRTPDGIYTKYSFPSKTMEYLLSGSKVVMHRLPGVPDEYYNYIKVINSNDNKDLKNALKKAVNDTLFYSEKTYDQVYWINKRYNDLNMLISKIQDNKC